MSQVLYQSPNDEKISRNGERQRAVQFEDELEQLRERVRKQQARDAELKLSPAPPVKTRKVAPAPAPKSYPGFSTPGQEHKQAKPKQQAVAGANSVQEDPAPAASASPAAAAPTRRARAVTPSDWRRGLELTQKELGPAPPMLKPSPPQPQQTESSGKKTATVRPHPRPAPQPPPPTDQALSPQQQQQQRRKHYDQDEIKEYLQQQKERRRQEKINKERQRAAEASSLRQKLKDLRQHQLEAVASRPNSTAAAGRRSAPAAPLKSASPTATPAVPVTVDCEAEAVELIEQHRKPKPQVRKKRKQQQQQPPLAPPAQQRAVAANSSGGSRDASPDVETDDNADEGDQLDQYNSPSTPPHYPQQQQQQLSADTLYRWCAVRDAASSLKDRVSRMARPGGQFWATLHPPHLYSAALAPASAAVGAAQLPLPGYRESPPAPQARAVTPAELDDENARNEAFEYAEAERLVERMPRGLDRIGRALLLHNFCAGQPSGQALQQQQQTQRGRGQPISRRTRRSEGTLPPKRYNLLHSLEHEAADPFAFRAVYSRQREAYSRRQGGSVGFSPSPQPASSATRRRREPRSSSDVGVGDGGGMMDGSMRPEDLRVSPSATATMAAARPSVVVVDRDVQTAPSPAQPATVTAASSHTDPRTAVPDTHRRRRHRYRRSRSRSRSHSSESEEEEERGNSIEQQQAAAGGRRRPASPPPAVASRRYQSQSRPPDGRLSPASLERMFQVELQFYDSLEESHRQLTELDRHRQVAQSNQETVVLAQVLKANRLGQTQESAAAKVEREKEVAEARALVAEAKAKNARLEEETASRLAKIRDDNLRLNAILAQFQAKPPVVLREDATQTAATSTPKPSRAVSATAARAPVTAASTVPASSATRDLQQQQQQPRKEKVHEAPTVQPSPSLQAALDEDLTMTNEVAGRDVSSASTTLLTASQSLLQTADATDAEEEEEEATEVYDEDDLDGDDDKSLREVLPSESQRRQTVKRQRRSGGNVAAPLAPSAAAPARADASYERLTLDIAHMYQQDEAGRRAYQAKLLALRQRSAKETAKKSLRFLRSLAANGGAGNGGDHNEVWPRERIAANERLVFEQYRLEKQQIQALRRLHGLQQQQQQQQQLKEGRKQPKPGAKARPDEIDDEDEADSSSLSQLDRQMRKLRPDSLTPREQRLHQRRQESRELVSWRSSAAASATVSATVDPSVSRKKPSAASVVTAAASATAEAVDSDSGSSASTLVSRSQHGAAPGGRSSPSSAASSSIATEVQPPTASRSYADSFEGSAGSGSAAPVDTARSARSSARSDSATAAAAVVETEASEAPASVVASLAATTPRTANETTVNETDVSEYESRIRALTRQMQERQQMLKRLKREHSRVSKDQLRQRERELLRRIEAYDKNIADLEKDLRRAAQGGGKASSSASESSSESASAPAAKRADKSAATTSAASVASRRSAAASSESSTASSASPRKATSTASPASAPASARSPRTQTASVIEAVEEEIDAGPSEEVTVTAATPRATPRSRRPESASSMTEEIEAAADASESSSTTVSGSRRVASAAASASAAAASVMEDIPPSSDSAGGGNGGGAYSEDFEGEEASSASASATSSSSQRRQALDSRDDSVRTASRQVTVSEPERDLRRHEDAEEVSASADVVEEEEDEEGRDVEDAPSARTPRTPRVVNFSDINEEYSFHSDDEKRPGQQAAKSPAKPASLELKLTNKDEQPGAEDVEKDDEEDVPMSARTIPSEMSDLPSEASDSVPSGRDKPASAESEGGKREPSAVVDVEDEEDIAEELPFDDENNEAEDEAAADETNRAASPLLIFDEKPPRDILTDEAEPTETPEPVAEDEASDKQLASAIQEASLHRSEFRADQLSDELTNQLLASAIDEAIDMRRRQRVAAAAAQQAPPIPPRPPAESLDSHALLDDDMWEEDLLDVAAAAKPVPPKPAPASTSSESREAPPTPSLTPALPLPPTPPPPTPLVPSSEAEVAELAGHSLRCQLARLAAGQQLEDEAPEDLVAMATLEPSAVAAAAASIEQPEDDSDESGWESEKPSVGAQVAAAAAQAGRAFAVGIHQLVTDELREVLQLPPPAQSAEPASDRATGEEAAATSTVSPADWEPPERTRYFLRPRFRRRPPSDETELVEAVRQRLAGVPGVCRLSTAPSAAESGQQNPRPEPLPQRIGKLQAWSAMKRRDRVDQVLVEELRQEEPGWVDYEVDETEAKLKVADEILAQLLSDTASCLRDLQGRAA